MRTEGTFFVYVDMKPDGEPFYVGKGDESRVKHKERNKWHTKVCNKYPDWSRDRVFEGAEAECFAEEKRLIAFYGRRDLGLGTLVNMTDGGEGVSGVKFSAESKAKMSAAKKGKSQSAEAIAKRAEALKGRTHSAEARANMSASWGKRPPASDEARKKFAMAFKGKTHSAESREKMSAAAKNVSAETIAKRSAKLKGKTHSAESRANMSAAAKKKPPVSAETRAKISAIVKAHHAARRAAAEAIANASESSIHQPT